MNRDFIWVLGGRLALALTSLLSIRCVSFFLTPEQYGDLAILVAFHTFVGFLIVNPLCQHLNRFIHEWWDDKTLIYRLLDLFFYILMAAFFGGFLVFFLNYKGYFDLLVFCKSLSVFFMVVAASWNGQLTYSLNMLGFRRDAVFWGGVTVIISLLFSIFFVWLYPVTVAWYIGQILGMIIGAVGAYYKILNSFNINIKDKIKYRVSFLSLDDIKSYCVPLALATGLMWLQWNGWRFIIEYYWGLESLGYLAMATTIASQIWGLFESFSMQFLFPYFFRRIANNKDDESLALSDMINLLGPIYIVVSGFFIVVSPFFLYILAGGKYVVALNFLMYAVLIDGCRVLSNVFALAVQVTRKTLILGAPYLIGVLVILFGLLYLGINNNSITQAIIVMVVGAVLMLFSTMFLMSKQIKYVIDYRRWGGAIVVFLLFAFGLLDKFEISSSFWFCIFLLGTSILTSCAMFLLTWKNPALHRLLKVSLQHKGIEE